MRTTRTINNRRAKYDYHLGKKIIAGIALTGPEVISIRHHRVSLKNTYVSIKDNSAWLQNLQIFTLQDQTDKEQQRNTHRLLLTKSQLRSLQASLNNKNNTIIPIRLILNKYIKIEIAPALGKRQYDKREVLKKRESESAIKRRLKKDRRG